MTDVLNQQQQRPVRLVDDETAVEVLEQVELTLEDVLRMVGILLLIGIAELVFDHIGAGTGQAVGRDDAELFNFAGQKDACRRE